MEEIWKTVAGHFMYEVSNLGNVRNRDTKKNLKQFTYSKKYLQVTLCYGKPKKEIVHRLVASAFIPNEGSKPQVNHVDGDTHNNCVENLEWVTARENTMHALRTGLRDMECLRNVDRKGRKGVATPKRVKKYNPLDGTSEDFESVRAAALYSGLSKSAISINCNRKRKTAGGFIWSFIDC